MKAITELALVIGCASLGALATWKIAGPPSRVVACDPATLSPEEICLATVQAEWPEGSFLWVDARPAADWKRNGIAGSIPVTLGGDTSFDEQIEASLEKLGTAQRVLVYCGSAGCGTSKEVAKRIRDLGFIPEVRALHGGWDALTQAGLVKDSSPAS
ncbi:rhodanese-like domain-containing protein [Luteolibacter flavescens]|uniref:Rhodanese-like domain-containing protein n=1 Tax=Luteolibacter flavescens TaxID=1859460 RepID=A0ABT3FW67_9BACT|nr:rhodanese-like domain-containing protein [Luteolibacter flavescens]MCW1887825.1 rhodanese-like domain-containing protein [Luteolibacter flavescens]